MAFRARKKFSGLSRNGSLDGQLCDLATARNFRRSSNGKLRMAGDKERGVCRALTAALFEYDTNKVVHIRSKTIGITNRLVQFTIICYIIV